MSIAKLGISQKGLPMHYSVGALIKVDDEYLLIDRAKPPYGFAGVAGHVDEGESEREALIREVGEESGLKIKKYNLLFEEELDWNECSKGIKIHYWHLYGCEITGEIKRNHLETNAIGWYPLSELKQLKLEPVWEYWFKKLDIL